MSLPRILFGADETFHTSLDDYMDDYFVFGGDEPGELTVEIWRTLPAGETPEVRMWSGADIAEATVEWLTDQCGFEQLAAELEHAAKAPDVVNAFNRARAALLSHQSFAVCDELIGHVHVTVYAGEDGIGWKRAVCGNCSNLGWSGGRCPKCVGTGLRACPVCTELRKGSQ